MGKSKTYQKKDQDWGAQKNKNVLQKSLPLASLKEKRKRGMQASQKRKPSRAINYHADEITYNELSELPISA